jgi:DNA-binding transcriptional regulator YhcF (GntR family)
MEFIYQENSHIPAHIQVKEQIKIALLLGNLRPGEMLPSIRDLEKELGINRNVIRKVYQELEELGILKMIQGKGVLVNKHLNYKENRGLLESCEQLVKQTQKGCQSRGLIFSSFARYLYHKAIEGEQRNTPLIYVDMTTELAKERAEEVSKILNVNVKGLSIEELKELKRAHRMRAGVKITCNYYRFEQVKKILRGLNLAIIPFRMTMSEKTRNELNQLPEGSKVMFIFDEQDKSTLGLILEDYKKAFAGHKLEFAAGSVEEFPRLVTSNGFAKYLLSNRIRNLIPEEFHNDPSITPTVMEFDPSSIEEAKMELGIIG